MKNYIYYFPYSNGAFVRDIYVRCNKGWWTCYIGIDYDSDFYYNTLDDPFWVEQNCQIPGGITYQGYNLPWEKDKDFNDVYYLGWDYANGVTVDMFYDNEHAEEVDYCVRHSLPRVMKDVWNVVDRMETWDERNAYLF